MKSRGPRTGRRRFLAAAGGALAATENFLVLENHSVDNPWWNDLVDGIPKPIMTGIARMTGFGVES